MNLCLDYKSIPFFYALSPFFSLSWLFRAYIVVSAPLLYLNLRLQSFIYKILQYNSYLDYEMIFWPLDGWRILINSIRSWSPWSRRILNPLIFRSKPSLNRNWILFIFLKRKLAIAWKGNCFTLIRFFCFKPSSSPTQLNFLGPSSLLERQGKIITLLPTSSSIYYLHRFQLLHVSWLLFHLHSRLAQPRVIMKPWCVNGNSKCPNLLVSIFFKWIRIVIINSRSSCICTI